MEREAVERAQELQPDLIVTDLSMPVMNGLEEARVLKKLMPTVPMIVFTPHSDPLCREGSRRWRLRRRVQISGCHSSSQNGSELARPDCRLTHFDSQSGKPN
jgi:CheY-like chemotaxis protein